MSDTRRDIELRIRASDLSTADFTAVTKAVNDLTAAIGNQTNAAKQGAVTLGELKQSATQLEQAGKSLTSIAALVDRFKDLSGVVAANQRNMDAARQSVAQYRTELEGMTNTGRAEEARLANLVKGLTTAEAAYGRNTTALAAVQKSLQQAGVDTADLATAEQALKTVADQIGPSLTRLNTAQAEYAKNLRDTKAAAAEQAAAERDRANALKAAADAQLAERRNQADTVAAAIRANEQRAATVTQRIAAEQKAQDQADAQAEARERANQARLVGLAIQGNTQREAAERENRARDAAATKAASDARVAAVQAEQDRIRQIIAGARNPALSPQQQIQQAGSSVDSIVAQLGAAGTQLSPVALAAAKKAAVEAATNTQVHKAIDEAVEALVARGVGSAGALRAAGAEIKKSLTAAGGAAAGSPQLLFGLKPYELQNLSYQINDVVTQLASGTRASQVFAQQGGQILQLWVPNLLSLKAFILPIIVTIAGLTVAVGALNHAFREQASLREFNGTLTATTNGLDYNAKALVSIQENVKRFGVSWSEAGKAIQSAIGAGVPQQSIERFIKIAQNISDVRGIKFEDAFKALVEGSRKGIQGIRDLNKEFDFLTVKEYEQVKALYDQNKASEAAALAVTLVEDRYGRAARLAISPFTQLTRDLATSWDHLLTTLGNSSVIQGLIANLTKLVEGIDRVVKGVDDLIGTASTADAPAGYNARKALARVGLQKTLDPADTEYDLKRLQQGTAITNPATMAGLNSSLANSLVTNGLKIDTASLQQLALILTSPEVKSTLPEGGRFSVLSSERPNSITRNGTASEHGRGRALDVHVVDANGNPIDMGVVGGMMAKAGGLPSPQVEAAMVAAAKRLFPGQPIAVGGTFGGGPGAPDYDPGHISIGGQEAINNAKRRGDYTAEQAANAEKIAAADEKVTSNQQKQVISGDTIADQDKLRLAQLNSYSEADLRAKIGRQAYQQAFAESQNEEVARAHETVVLREHDNEIAKERIVQQQEDLVRQAQYKENAGQIVAAGLAQKQAFLDTAKAQNLLITRQEVRAAQLRGESEQVAKIAEQERARSELTTITNQMASLARQHELTQSSDLEARLKAVDNQYTAIFANIEKFRRQNPALAGQADVLEAQAKTQAVAARQDEEAKARLEELNNIISTRNTLVQTYTALLDKGLITQTEFEEKSKAAYEGVSGKVTELTGNFREFLSEADKLDPTKVELYRAKLQDMQAQAKYVPPLLKAIQDALGTGFTTGISQGFNTIAESIGNVIAGTGKWKDVLTATETAVGQLFSTLLKDIAEAILKYEALKLASALGLTGDAGGSGGISSFLGSLFGAGGSAAGAGSFAATGGLYHQGGVVGPGAPTRAVDPAWFVGAPRYHRGTVVGLSRGEQAAILQHGEEVLTRDDPRNVMNRGAGGGAPVNIRSVLVFDEKQIPQAMAGTEGERTVMAHIVRNAATVRQLVRG